MYLSSKDFKNFTKALSKVNDSAKSAMEQYINQNGLDDIDALVKYGYGVSNLYGTASASLAASMYDEIVNLQGKAFAPAENADNPEFGEVAQAIQGSLKTSVNPREVSGAVSRLVKRTGQDTLIKNGMRDRAEFAWIPVGDTCPLCITIASRGWQPISKKALKNGHAEHIHSNCDCSYMIRHDSSFDVAGYKPEKYLEEYENAEGKTSSEKINSMRRMQYAERKDVINAQKRSAYAARTKMDYRHERDPKSIIIEKTKEGNIAAKQIIGSPNGIFVSDALNIKPKKLQEIENNVTEYKKLIGIEGKTEPKIIIVSDTELGNAGGRYDAKNNIVYYKAFIDKETQKRVNLHELYHWDDAQKYINEGNVINSNIEFINIMCNKCRPKLDKLGITSDNVGEISDYARRMYSIGRFDEVYTEYRTVKGMK